MTQKQQKALRVTYYALVCAALAAAAVLMMVACVGIYRTGDHPFNREVVAAAFGEIALPVYVCLGLVAVGIVLHPLLPIEDKSNPDLTPVNYQRIQSRVDLSLCPAELVSKVNKERSARLINQIITAILLVIGSVVFLTYALNPGNFHQSEITGSMMAAMWVLLPCVGVPFAYGVFTAFFGRASKKREIALLKEVPDEAKVAPVAADKKSCKAVAILRCAILVVAIGCILGGLLNNGWADVLTKAINICTECIGLG